MIDVTEGLAEQDKKIAQLIVRRGKGVVLVLNKIDALKGIGNELEAIKDRVRFLFPILNFAPLVPISALEGDEIGKLLDTVWAVWRQLNKRIDTNVLNDCIRRWGEEYEPPRGASGHYKILYGTQVSVTPVRFLLFVNRIKDFPESYLSYVKNLMRKELGFSSIPIEISLRERRRNPSLYEKGPKKEEVEISKVIKESRKKTTLAKGIAKKPGGKARLGKERERAEKIVRNQKQKRRG